MEEQEWSGFDSDGAGATVRSAPGVKTEAAANSKGNAKPKKQKAKNRFNRDSKEVSNGDTRSQNAFDMLEGLEENEADGNNSFGLPLSPADGDSFCLDVSWIVVGDTFLSREDALHQTNAYTEG